MRLNFPGEPSPMLSEPQSLSFKRHNSTSILEGYKKKVKFSQGKGPCSFILSSYPFAFRRKQNTCMQSQSPPNRTAMVSPVPDASNSRLSTALCSRQETPEKGPLGGGGSKSSTHIIPLQHTRAGFITLQNPGTALHILKRHLPVFYLRTARMRTITLYFELSPT